MIRTSPAAARSGPDTAGRLSILLAAIICVLTLAMRAGALAYLATVSELGAPAGGVSLRAGDLAGFLKVAVIASFGALIVIRSASRRYGWLMLATACCLSLVEFATQYSQYAVPAELPLAETAAWVHDLWMAPMALIGCLAFLFPDGRLPARRWRWVFVPLISGWTVLLFVYAFADRPLGYETFLARGITVPNPLGFIPYPETAVQGLFVLLVPATTLGGLAGLVDRFRRAQEEVRQQIKWVLYFMGMAAVALAASYIHNILLQVLLGIDLGLDRYIGLLLEAAWIGVGAALGLAILKHRLYAIDLIVNRVLVYGGLTLVIVSGYVVLVSFLGALLPGGADSLVPSVIATGLVAVLFAPLKDRLQRGANRLVFGERQRPYEVMRTLGAQLDGSRPERVLPAIAETLVRVLKFPFVSIALARGGDRVPAASFGSRRRRAVDFPLTSRLEEIGRLTVCLRDGETALSRQDRELLQQIALWLAPVARASLLARDLHASNARLITARAEERRRLYRDLHDGLGPALASQTLRFDHALDQLPEDPQGAMRTLAELKEQTQDLVLEIRRLVYDLRSSALDELGLLGSLHETIESFRGATGGMQIVLVGDETALRRLPAAHEQALERIALEALTNAVRHSGARHCRLVIDTGPSVLKLTVEDDGCGLAARYRPGVGIASMIERAEALGGGLRIEPVSSHGTRVVATLPLAAALPPPGAR